MFSFNAGTLILFGWQFAIAIGAPPVAWVGQASTSGVISGQSIAVDANDYSYVTGSADGSSDFFGTAVNSPSAPTTYVAKLKSDGGPDWVKTISGTGAVQSTGIAVDLNGNSYISGVFQGTADFFGTSLTSNPYIAIDAFVLKLKSDGGIDWVKQLSAPGDTVLNAIATYPNGDCFVTGSFEGTMTIDTDNSGTVSITSSGKGDAYLIGWNTGGTVLYRDKMGGPEWDEGKGIAVDGNDSVEGNLYVTGSFESTADFFGTTLTEQGTSDGFVVKVDHWVKQFGGPDPDVLEEIAVDLNDNVYLTGGFHNTVDFFGTVTKSSQGVYDIFVAKLDSAGNLIWDKTFGTAGTIAKGDGIAVDATGNLYITGDFEGTLSLEPGISLTSYGSSDAFVVKLDPMGVIQWSNEMGGSDVDFAFGIAVSDSKVFVSGLFSGTATFPPLTATTSGVMAGFACMLEFPSTNAPTPPTTPVVVGTGLPGGRKLMIKSDGATIAFGAAGDVLLYRSGPNWLKAPGNVEIGGTLVVDGMDIKAAILALQP
jgi:hypothetical protein